MSSIETSRPSRPEVLSTGKGSWSLSTRLTAWYALTSCALILVSGLVLYGGLSRSLYEEDDVFLVHLVDVLRGLLAQYSEDSREVRWEVESEWSSADRAQVFIRILDEDGRATLKTPGIDEHLRSGPSQERSGRARRRPRVLISSAAPEGISA
jgi:hypothetical protein